MPSGTDPQRLNADRMHMLPAKYGDNLWLRELTTDLEGVTVAKIRIRAKIADPDDPSDPSAVTSPIYGPIEIPGLGGRSILGAYGPAFSIDPSGSLDPSDPSASLDPSAGDIGVVRIHAAPYGPNALRFGLFSLDAPGDWPGATAGALVTPEIEAAATRLGGVRDGVYTREGPPAGASYLKSTVTHILTTTTGDPSDPSSSHVYTLMYSDGTRLQDISVNVLADQPAVNSPWPLDRESSRYAYQVLDTQRAHERAYPRRNAYVVPTLGDDPLHAARGFDQINRRWVTAIRTEQTQDPVAGNVTVQRITLNDGATVTAPTGTTYAVGQDYDPSGMDPSAVDPSGYSPVAVNPTLWWEFDIFLLLVANSENDGTVGGYASDIWPIWPNDLTGAILTPVAS